MDSQTYQLVTILADEWDYVTYQTIAKKMAVSSRTVSRVVPAMTAYLKENHFRCSVKKGKGIKLLLNEEERERLEQLLNAQKVTYYSAEERMAFIVIELMDSPDPVKVDYLAHVLGVSPMTIYGDLEVLEERMLPFNLLINKQKGKGITIGGTDFDRVMYAANFLFETIDVRLIDFTQSEPFSLIMFGHHLSSSIRKKLYGYLPMEEMLAIHQRFEKSATKLRFLLADGGYFKFILTTSLLNQNLHGKNPYTKKYPELVEEMIDLSLKQSKPIVSEPEAEFVNHYLSSARKTSIAEKWNSPFSKAKNEDEEIDRIRRTFYQTFEGRMDMTSVFIQSFDHHVYLFLQRYKNKLQVKNQYTGMFQEEYPHIFSRTRELMLTLGYQQIIDDEVVFLAMHVLGAILDKDNASNVKRIAVVCSSGFGTSKVLRESLKKRFPQLEIEAEANDSMINELEFIKKNIDLIVSTIPVDTTFVPSVMVNPFLSQNDVLKIEKVLDLETAQLKDRALELDSSKKSAILSKEKCDLITHVLTTFYFKAISQAESIEQIIDEIASDTMPAETAPLLAEALKERERFGSSVIDDHGILLLHCKFEDHIQLGIVRISCPVEYHTIDGMVEIDTILLMVVPKVRNKEIVGLFGTISSSLVLEADFLQQVKTLEPEKLVAELRSVMEKSE